MIANLFCTKETDNALVGLYTAPNHSELAEYSGALTRAREAVVNEARKDLGLRSSEPTIERARGQARGFA